MKHSNGHRAVVVDDSQFMRTVIADMLEDGGIHVVDRAKNGEEAVESVARFDPDVVTMDVEMPGMDGLEATERIMEECPTPILMLSAHTDDGGDITFDALERGAVDFFTKPGGEISIQMGRFEEQLVDKVRSVAVSDVTGPSLPEPSEPTPSVGVDRVDAEGTVVIGSSTGGPRIVERILADLPLGDLRIVVVQHMPVGFTERFAARLDARSAYVVREASDGDRVSPGEAVIAPGGSHLICDRINDGRLHVSLTDDPPVNSVRPSIDVTMQSIARVATENLVGVILTGMGRDGAAGIRSITANGGRAIAQDESTSSVFGMPRRAIETGAVDAVLPAADIPQGVIDLIDP